MEEKNIYAELNAIKNLMERSTKFISLSGLSGILAGVYAAIGAFFGYLILKDATSLDFEDATALLLTENEIWTLFIIASLVLIFSVLTGVVLTIKQSKKKNEAWWNPISKRLVYSMAIPLIAGGILVLILFFKAQYGMIASICLLFYGLALVAGSQYTFSDVRWLGIFEIILGLLAATVPQFGLWIWAFGFGVLHILYGAIMHFKYQQ